MMKKVYVHYIDKKNNVEKCTVQFVNQETSGQSFLSTFIQSCAEKIPNNSFQLRHTVFHDLTNCPNVLLYDLLNNEDDVDIIAVGNYKTLVDNKAGFNEKNESKMLDIKKQCKEINQLFNKKYYRKGRLLCEEVLQHSSMNKDFIIHQRLVEILYASNQYEEAIKACKRGLSCHPNSISLKFLQAKIYLKLESYDDALDIIQSLLNIPIKDRKSIQNEEVDKKKDLSSNDFTLDLLAIKSKCLYELGNHQQAANVINQSMAYPEADTNESILTVYAYISMQYNKLEEAVRALLKGISIPNVNKDVKQMFAEILNSEDGFSEFLKQIPLTASSISAYAFIATIMKDWSSVKASIRLYEYCVQFMPTSASYALNLSHVHEIDGNYDKALAVIKQFAHHNANLSINGFSWKMIYSLLELLDVSNPAEKNKYDFQFSLTWNNLEDGTDNGNSSKFGSNGRVVVTSKIKSTDITTASTDMNQVEEDLSMITTLLPDLDQSLYNTLQPFMVTGKGPMEQNYPLKTISMGYNDSQLDSLALLFTLIKILYLKGKLSLLPPLIICIEPVRCASITPLHETFVRNEHAYYLAIAQILCYRSSQSTSRDDYPFRDIHPKGIQKPIFVCGDSHTLSLAWSSIRVEGSSRLLVPKLVTGVKQFHLRPESKFYPKAHFLNNLKTIPKGSEVILMIGEIDCREGLLTACERDYYPSIEDAMKKTVESFVQQVIRSILLVKHQYKVYVHPVAPVLNETRSMVILFNQIYKRCIQKLASSKSMNVKWLDIFDDLLSVDTAHQPNSFLNSGFKLNEDYQLDGTHLKPNYVKLIENVWMQ